MRLLLLFPLLACFVFPAAAESVFSPQVWIHPGLFSYHFDRSANYRENNIGLGAELHLAPNHALMAGTFINSERSRTRYAGYQWRPLHWRPEGTGLTVSAGLAATLLDGYPGTRNGNWFIAPMPVLALEHRLVGVNFTFVPNIQNRGAIALQFKLRVW